MKIEILKNNCGYIYTENKLQIDTDLYKILSQEIINKINIYCIEYRNLQIPHAEEITTKFVCKHNKEINYKSLNYLPSEDWQELIECWSCHNNEFASVKKLSIKVRPNGILVSSFFLLINSIDMPPCCNFNDKISKIWFNDLSQVNHKKVLFNYLQTYFKSNNIFTLNFKDEVYDIKYFYTCKFLIINDIKYYNVIKIGIKEKEEFYKIPKNNEFINDFYLELLYKSIDFIGINVLGYKTGFIYY